MTVDDFAKALDAVTRLVAALIWPALLLFVLLRYGAGLREFLSSLSEFSLKGAGLEASAKRRQAEAAGALAAAAVANPTAEATPEVQAENAKAAATVATETVTRRAIERASTATVLWVDDRPDNNIFERQAFEAIGIRIVLAKSTDKAMEFLRHQAFDVIISDMGRPPDSRAGYTLLDRLRASGNRTPFVIYAGSDSPEHKAEARRHGALDSTNRPDELFKVVLAAIQRNA